ncbi:Six-hairpin glycosidase [Delitschia confertaspora ATCC 74209]|uniref:Six-hairpin glycosidase n=1 Tax=Delitschia confertaspora ATCC 74209 TaxID=1513339 RepID=A0A9P4JM27_9PLEO|nr:Six-hairpin glycosidase [Delitschia confertaspora ATCC 74209]
MRKSNLQFWLGPLLSVLEHPHSARSRPTRDTATTRATAALSTLQTWYNAQTGLWNTAGWWNSANIMTVIADLVLLDTSTKGQAERVFRNTFIRAPAGNPLPGVENENENSELRRRNEDGMIYDKVLHQKSGMVSTTYGPDSKWSSLISPNFIYDRGTIGPQKILYISNAAASEWLDGFYDDDAWWALAWIAAFDVTKEPAYLLLAEDIFAALLKAWPTNCGGGIWWSYKRTYANAIANELFLSLAAHLANRVGTGSREIKAFYVDWAKRELDWFRASGMINERGTVNDGLTADCKNNNFTTWSYNQGVILSGLVELNRASPDPSYLSLASSTAKAAITELSDASGILHDKCGPNCGGDASQFKGIFIRGLQKLHEAAPDEVFERTIRVNAESVWKNDRDAKGRMSTNWAGPVVEGANATTHSSAMEALIADIAVT